MNSTINELCQEAWETAEEKGFHEFIPRFGFGGRDGRHFLSLLMLITTEVSEAAEEVRKGTDLQHFTEELADVCIRTFDLAWMAGVDLEGAIYNKMDQNASRPRKHGKLV